MCCNIEKWFLVLLQRKCVGVTSFSHCVLYSAYDKYHYVLYENIILAHMKTWNTIIIVCELYIACPITNQTHTHILPFICNIYYAFHFLNTSLVCKKIGTQFMTIVYLFKIVFWALSTKRIQLKNYVFLYLKCQLFLQLSSLNMQRKCFDQKL